MPPVRRGAPIHRGAQGCQPDLRVPAFDAGPSTAPLLQPGTAAAAAATTGAPDRAPRDGPGGGGGGKPRPTRSDLEQQLRAQFAPGQEHALAGIHRAFHSPRRRLQACRARRDGDFHPELPLSPIDKRPCSTPNGVCNCEISHHKVKNELGLTSVQQSVSYAYEHGERGKATRAEHQAKRQRLNAEKAAAVRAGVDGAAHVLLAVSTIVPQSPGTTARQDTTVSREGSPAGGLDALAAVALNEMDLD